MATQKLIVQSKSNHPHKGKNAISKGMVAQQKHSLSRPTMAAHGQYEPIYSLNHELVDSKLSDAIKMFPSHGSVQRDDTQQSLIVNQISCPLA